MHTSSAWEGRISRFGKAGGPGLTLDVKVKPVRTADAGKIGTLLTMSDATVRLQSALREQRVLEGERLKSGVAWALSADAPFDSRCAGALATLLSLEGGGGSGAIYLVPLDKPTDLQLFSYVGDEPNSSLGRHCAHALARCSTVIACDEAHGHYILPLVHLGEPLGYLAIDPPPARRLRQSASTRCTTSLTC